MNTCSSHRTRLVNLGEFVGRICRRDLRYETSIGARVIKAAGKSQSVATFQRSGGGTIDCFGAWRVSGVALFSHRILNRIRAAWFAGGRDVRMWLPAWFSGIFK
jgi:hypothetical protein